MRRERSRHFGEAITKTLVERGLTQAALASSTCKSESYISQTISGNKGASPKWVDLVAETLKLSEEQRKGLHAAAAKDKGYEIDLGVYGGTPK